MKLSGVIVVELFQLMLINGQLSGGGGPGGMGGTSTSTGGGATLPGTSGSTGTGGASGAGTGGTSGGTLPGTSSTGGSSSGTLPGISTGAGAVGPSGGTLPGTSGSTGTGSGTSTGTLPGTAGASGGTLPGTSGVISNAISTVASSTAGSTEAQVITLVLASYPGATLTRPAPPWQITNVSISLIINSFFGIDDLGETMGWSGIIKATWNDTYISWDETQYGVANIHLRYKDIWLPLFIQNSAPGSVQPIFNADDNQNSDVLTVLSNGTIKAAQPGAFYTQCNLDLRLFPFDSQQCQYTYQAWSYTYDYLTMLPKDAGNYSVLSSNSLYSPQWQITNIQVEQMVVYFMGNPYSAVTYTFTASRRSNFYVMNVTMPCILMALLALGTFLFPLDNSRAAYGVTVVLGFAVYQTVIISSLPSTATPISLVIYIIAEMFIAGIISLYSAIAAWLVSIFASNGTPLPEVFARISCLHTRRPVTHKVPRNRIKSSAVEIQAALRMVNKIEQEKIDNVYQNEWLHFFNFVDIVFMLMCAFLTILMPILIFYTTLMEGELDANLSSVPTNYVENSYAVTKAAPPSTPSTPTQNIIPTG